MVQIAAGLRDRGYDVTAVIGGDGGDTAERLRAKGIPFVVDGHNAFRMGPVLRRLAAIRGLNRCPRVPYWLSLINDAVRLARVLRRLDVDIVHSHVISSILVTRIAGLIARVPIRVAMVPGPLQLQWPFLRQWDLDTLWMDQRVLSGSAFTADLYRKLGVPESRIARVYYGVDPASFDRGREDAAAVRAELGVGPDVPLVGQIAYFYGGIQAADLEFPLEANRGLKGHEDFVDAARLVHEVRPEVRFVIVGDGWGEPGEQLYRQVRQQAHDLGLDGIVIFAGRRKRSADVLAALDVSVQASLSDNYAGTLESLLMEAPTIATDVGAMPEAVRHEETGLLVPPRDPSALAAAMLRLIDDRDLARRLGAAGRELVRNQFTIQQTVDGVDRVYRELAQERGITRPPIADPSQHAAHASSSARS
jgi:glycosyltransferase involved in cell wall biosynthesis